MAIVNVIIPVFNRITWTISIIEQLYAQSSRHSIKIIVIDDGSSDGTAEYLKSQENIVTLKGNGSLWWSGSINLGLKYLIQNGLSDSDYVLFLNNDVYISTDYVKNIVSASSENDNVPVGSILYELNKNRSKLKSIGPLFDYKNIDLYDANKIFCISDISQLSKYYDVDALSGRGTLYPGGYIIRNGLMRSRLLPHYHADYEYAARLKKRGIRLIVSSNAIITSPPEYGNDTKKMKFKEKWFGKKSADNIFYTMIFYYLLTKGLWKIKSLFIVPYPFIKDCLKYIFLQK